MEKNRVLVLENKHRGETWYELPGGALQSPESIEQCAIREAMEEVCLVVEPVRIAFVRDYLSAFGNHNVEICFLSRKLSGDAQPGGDPDRGEQMIHKVHWMDENETRNLKLLNYMLPSTFWQDVANRYPYPRYEGQYDFRNGLPI